MNPTYNPNADRTLTPTGYMFGGKEYVQETRTNADGNQYKVDVLKGSAPAPNVSTTTISNENKINQAKNLQSQVADMSKNRGAVTDGETVKYADGSIFQDTYQEPVLPVGASPIYGTVNGKQNRIIGYNQFDPVGGQKTTYLDSNGPNPAKTPEEVQFDEITSAIKASTDAQTARAVSAIENKFKVLREQQKQINDAQAAGVKNALLTGGVTGKGSSAQYAPISSEGIVTAQLNYGLQKVAELDAQELDLINEAQAAGQAQNFKLLEKKLAQVEAKREEKAKETAELNKKIAEESAKKRERLLQSTTDTAIADLYASGVTEPLDILKSLSKKGIVVTSKEISEVLKNMAESNGVSTSKLSQEVQEFYKLKSEKDGLPVSVLGLKSTAEQIAAYIKMKTRAETKATGGSSGGASVPTTSDGKVLSYDDPTYTITAIRNSKGKKELTGEQTKPISKALQAISQVDALAESLVGQVTGPIMGTIRSANPYDVKAQIIKGQLQALIPNLARGVYGEVGVLTDADIENYSKTIGNLKSQKEVNDALVAITQKAAFNSIKTSLEGMAASGRDVSGFEPIFLNAQKNIEAKLPKTSIVGGSAPQDFLNNPLPSAGSVGDAYNPSVWNLFK